MFEYPKLTEAIALENHLLLLTFNENERRIYDFKPNLKHKYFSILSNPVLFRNVSVNDGEIEWQTGQDFCPHTLYDESKAYTC